MQCKDLNQNDENNFLISIHICQLELTCPSQHQKFLVYIYTYNSNTSFIFYQVHIKAPLIFQSGSNVDQYLCNTGNNYQHAIGTQPVVRSSVVQLPGHLASSIITSIELNHTIAFMGTSEGQLLKVKMSYLYSSTSIFPCLNQQDGSAVDTLIIFS